MGNLGYIALMVISNLENPYWVIGLTTPLVMLPLVIDVDRLNREWGIVGSRYSRFGFGHIAIITLMGGALLLFAISTMLADAPSTQVVDGSDVPSHVVEILREYELLAEDESIIYYYSGGMFSYLEDGNYFTENRVVSYVTDVDEFYAEEANYSSIADIDVNYSESLFYDSEVYITRNDESEYILYVSAEEERDHLFVDELLARWKEGRQPSDTADDTL